MKKVAILGIATVAMLALVVSSQTVLCCVGPGLSPGFWKHNLGVYLGEANGSYSDPGVTGLRIAEAPYYLVGPSPPVTKYNMEAWFDALAGAPWNVDLEQAYADLNTKGGGAAGAATRVAAANIFNYWADLYPY
jgi:hypothetical protein